MGRCNADPVLTFRRWLAACRGYYLHTGPKVIKVFWFFFSKKNRLLPCFIKAKHQP
jgi:hypothetical protein